MGVMQLFKGKMKNLENSRLELDGSRRGHIQIENKIAKQESKNSEVDAKHTTHIQSKDASVAGMHCRPFVRLLHVDTGMCTLVYTGGIFGWY